MICKTASTGTVDTNPSPDKSKPPTFIRPDYLRGLKTKTHSCNKPPEAEKRLVCAYEPGRNVGTCKGDSGGLYIIISYFIGTI